MDYAWWTGATNSGGETRRMKKMRSLAAGLALALGMTGLSLGSAQAAPVTFTNFPNFVTAVGTAQITAENFDSDIPGGPAITFDNGVVSTLADGRLTLGQNAVIGSLFRAELSSNADSGALNLTWTFPEPVVGFGLGFTFLSPIQMTISELGLVVDITDTLGDNAGFLGVIDSTSAFSQIQFSVLPGNTQGFMAVDSLLLVGTASVVEVPEPATLALFGLGLAGFALTRRRKRPVCP